MIFQIFFTLALELLVLIVATFLVVKSFEEKAVCKWLARVVGFIVMGASILLIGFSLYFMNQPAKTKPMQQMNQPTDGKPRLQLQMSPTAPPKGGIIDPKTLKVNP